MDIVTVHKCGDLAPGDRVEVVDEVPGSPHQALIFDAADGLADPAKRFRYHARTAFSSNG
jgi:molybdopterin synthase catalytic subunit